MCQAQEPGTEAALLRVERSCSTPDGQEDLLHEFLGGRSLQTLQSQVKHQARVAAVERAERLVPAVRQLEHQLFIGTCRVSPRRGRTIVAIVSHRLGYTLDGQSGLPIRMAADGVTSTSHAPSVSVVRSPCPGDDARGRRMCGGSARAFTGVEHCRKPDHGRSHGKPSAAPGG